jgi:excisionase family DNA binding protein
MPRSKTGTRREVTKQAARTRTVSGVETSPQRADEFPEVLTLAEAAAYLRVPEPDVVHMVGPRGLPGRLIGSEWRFSKTALDQWLRTPPERSSKESLLSLSGAWTGDPDAEEMLKEIYRQRGRPIPEKVR